MISNANGLDLSALDGLSEEERAYALKILQQFSDTGKSDLLDDLKYSDFAEVPVDVHTFMHDPQYLGKALTDQEGRFTVFPYWEGVIEDIFPDNITTRYNTVVFTGAIGIGKSTIAVICLLYLLYRLLCLKDPYLYYGMQPIDKISISMMNITIENAKGVALDKMNNMILQSDWFMSHGEMGGTTNLVFRPEKHIEIIAASGNNQIVGRALFANFTDEVNFGLVADPEKQKKKMMKIITQIDARMKSRFLRGTYLPTLNIIASSKDSEQSFLEAFIQNKRDNESKNTLVIDKPQWVVDSRKDSPIKFQVAIGDRFKPNELLPYPNTQDIVDEYKKKGYEIWDVPIGYLDTFQQNLDEAICSIIGISTASTLKYMSGEKIRAAQTDTYKNPFIRDIITVGNSPDDYLQYANFFDLSLVSEQDKAMPLFIHLDMSMTGDKTGIAGVWITGRELNLMAPKDGTPPQITEGLEQPALEESAQDLHYKLAFSVSVQAPKGAQVSFAKNRNFIRWLRDQGFAIKGVSSDTFQSATLQQELKADNFKTSIISVDRVQKDANGRPICLPYHYFKSAIYERKLMMYATVKDKCELLETELLGLERHSDGHINHPDNGRTGSKDQADAVCGALYLASQYSEEFSYNYANTFDVTFDLNSTVHNENARKEQLITDFQNELLKINAELDETARRQQKEDYQDFQNILDGIIAF